MYHVAFLFIANVDNAASNFAVCIREGRLDTSSSDISRQFEVLTSSRTPLRVVLLQGLIMYYLTHLLI